jgi:hypothetical protein
MRRCERLCLLGVVAALPLGWLLSAPAPLRKRPAGLYSDAKVEAALRSVPHGWVGDFAELDLMPSGETRPLGGVLRRLGFEKSRLRPEPEPRAWGKTLRYTLHVSPSYSLTFMATLNVEDPFDLTHEVYGVRIVKR